MEALATLRDKLYKLRYIILAVLLVIITVTALYLVIKGSFTGGLVVENTEIEYGTAVSYNAKALFSDVKYQFKSENATEWSESLPIIPGNYEIRAVSKGSFGISKYSSIVKYKIIPKSIDVFVKGEHIAYGDSPSVDSSRLAYSDKITDFDFIFTDRTESGAKVKIVDGTLKISDKNGNDIFFAYKVNFLEKNMAFTPREIVIQTSDAEKVYDGKPLTNSNWSVSDTFAYDDYADFSSLHIIGSQTLAGSVENAVDISNIKVYSSSGENVTMFYDIKVQCGTLKVNKRPIKVCTGSAFMWYNGIDSLSCGDFKLTDGELAEGHTLMVNGDIPQISEECIVENKIPLVVLDKNGNDVTSNYDIVYDYGTLEIRKKIPVYIKPIDISLIYDGTPKTYRNNDLFTVKNLIDGHTYNITVKIVGSRTDIGVSESTLELISAEFYDSEGNVADCYHVVLQVGTIEVKKADIEICSNSINVNGSYYIGTTETKALSLGKLSVMPEGYSFKCVNPYTVEIYKFSDLQYTANISDFSGNVETKTSDSPVFENPIGEIRIFDRYGNDVTENFNITLNCGTITLN